MVLLTTTTSIVEALNLITDAERLKVGTFRHYHPSDEYSNYSSPCSEKLTGNQINQIDRQIQESGFGFDRNIPDLTNPKVGDLITHRQILDLYEIVKSKRRKPYHLEDLLRGSKLYIPPPPPKPELTPEYKSLMACLRREEEARTYQQIINPSSSETFKYHSPCDSTTLAFSSSRPLAFDEADEVTYTDVNRQVTLILNVLISIIACGAAIWVAAKYWSTPMRLALSMSGSIFVGIAEVFIYTSYIRRVSMAKTKEKSAKEVKKIVKSWNIQASKGIVLDQGSEDSPILEIKDSTQNSAMRRRK